MKVTLTPPPGVLFEVHCKDGKVLKNADLADIQISPFFSVDNGPGDVLRGKVVSEGDITDVFSLSVSGSNGKTKCRSSNFESSAVPRIDKLKARAKARATAPAK